MTSLKYMISYRKISTARTPMQLSNRSDNDKYLIKENDMEAR